MLQRDSNLDKLALSFAYRVAQDRYLSHYTKDGITPEQRAKSLGINFDYLGENLALASNPLSAHQAMMNSVDHKANIEMPVFKKIGIAAISISPSEKIFVEEFSN